MNHPNLTSREVKNENADNQNSETSFRILMKKELIVITVIFKFYQKMSVKNGLQSALSGLPLTLSGPKLTFSGLKMVL